MPEPPMQITALRTRVAVLPVRKRVVGRMGTFDRIWFVLLDLDTDTDLRGLSYLWTFRPHIARAVQAILADLEELTVGEDPFFTTRLWRRMWQQISQYGHKGLAVMALSGIDVAVWDIVGKAAGRPLAHVLGAHFREVPTYASEGLWLTDDLDALAREAEEFAVRGFRAMKMRLGRPEMRQDLEAVRVIREAIGPDVALMVDANQGWDVEYAIRIGRELERFGLTWLEEPVAHDDLVGHARVAAALDTPLATGENIYSPQGFREAIEQRALDVVMPDVERVGGVTGWTRTAALAEAWHLPICSHLFPEISVHLVASAPTGYYLEHMPWGEALFRERPELVNGAVRLPEGPGLGLSWDETAIRAAAPD